MKELLLAVTAALLASAAPAMARQSQHSQAAQEVRIPFVAFGAIRNFRNEGDRVVYLQGTHRQWYRATLNGPCINLPHALRLGFDTRYNGGTLDNSSTLIVDGEPCRIMSLVRSEEPPRRRRSRR